MKKFLFPLITIVLILSLVCTVQAGDRNTSVKTLLSSATVTASTSQTSSFNVEAYNEGIVYIDVTAESGTSTLDIIIETSPDNSEWYTHTTVSQISATGNTAQAITNFGKFLRVKYTVGGTSFTFSIKGVFKN